MGRLPVIFNDADKLDALAFEVARNAAGASLPMDELLPSLDVTAEEFALLLKDKLFTRALVRHKKEFEESGGSFQTRAKIVAGEVLQEMYLLVHDKDAPASVRRQGINDIVRWAGWDNTAALNKAAATHSGFSITFNITPPEAPQGVTIDAKPLEE